jgi:hypothetical protein
MGATLSDDVTVGLYSYDGSAITLISAGSTNGGPNSLRFGLDAMELDR